MIVGAVMLIAASCSSTTTVQSGTRLPVDPTPSAEPSPTPRPDPGPEDSAQDDADESAAGNADTAADADSDEADRESSTGQAQIESLIVDCEQGSDLACDILFQVSEFRSEPEAIALTCGGRGEPTASLFCTDGVSAEGQDLWFDDASPALPGIAEDCEGGDMTACDFLFFRSAVGSRYEALGNGCAGLTEVALPDCRTLFGE